MPPKKSASSKPYDFSRLTKSSDEICAMVFRRMANPLSKLLILHTSITPNQVSVFSFFVALAGAVFFAMGGYANMIWGGLLFFVYVILDHVDGSIARIKNMGSKKGQWFDGIIGFVSIPMAIFSLAYGIGSLYAMTLCALAIIAYPMQYLIMHFYKLDIVGINAPMGISKSGKLDFFKKFYGSMMFFMLLFVAIIINKPIWLLLFFATVGNLVWMFTIFLQYRNLGDR